MKLIVDISEEAYKRCYVIADLDGSPILKAIKNGIPLDDIKAEIDHDLKNAPYLYDEEHLDELYGFQDGIEHVLHIIDKHIRERSE